MMATSEDKDQGRKELTDIRGSPYDQVDWSCGRHEEKPPVESIRILIYL